MNTPILRFAGISSGLAARLPRPRLSKPDVALLGAAGAVALAIVGFGFVGNQAPDTMETAAVLPPRLVLPQTAKVIPPLQKPTESAPMRAPVATNNTHLIEPAKPAVADGHLTPGPHERNTAQATMQADVPDASGTASIIPQRGTSNVQVAETEADVAKLEAATGMLDQVPEPASIQPAAPSATSDTKLAAVSQPDLKPAKVTKYVNLRDGPADEAQVLTVVPANADIDAEADCGWCTVVYKGQRGYVYKSFIRRGVAEEAAAGQGLF